MDVGSGDYTVSIGNKGPFYARIKASMVSGRDMRGHPYMTSALRGEGVSKKEDVVREVA